MSTNAFIIAKVPGQNTAREIYVHWDGGFWGVGAVLLKSYTNDAAVQALIDGGDMSSLAEHLEACSFYKTPSAVATPVPLPYPFGDGEPLGVKTTEVVCFDRKVYEYYWDGQNWYTDGDTLLGTAVAIYNAMESAKNAK